jgi:hypothetical protein
MGFELSLIRLESRKPSFYYFRRRISYFYSDQIIWKGEASLYGRRWRSNFTVQALRRESTGDILFQEDISRDVTDNDGKSRP